MTKTKTKSLPLISSKPFIISKMLYGGNLIKLVFQSFQPHCLAIRMLVLVFFRYQRDEELSTMGNFVYLAIGFYKFNFFNSNTQPGPKRIQQTQTSNLATKGKETFNALDQSVKVIVFPIVI
jgi:hypothetical protein